MKLFKHKDESYFDAQVNKNLKKMVFGLEKVILKIFSKFIKNKNLPFFGICHGVRTKFREFLNINVIGNYILNYIIIS